MWKAPYARASHSNDIWRLRSISGTLKQVFIVVWYDQTCDEDTENVENHDAIKHTADGLLDVLTRILCLGRGDRDKFDTLEREGCLDKHAKDSQESAEVARFQVSVYCSWVLPIAESNTV